MNAALASLLALLLAIILSMITRLNVGLVAMALAWLVGVYVAGMKPAAVIAGFPATLFLTLVGVTLLFACAEVNGALKNLAQRVVSSIRGKKRLLPALFFLIALIVSTVGPGAISSVALIIPLAMAIGKRAGLPTFLIALMVANGANAGNLSPVSAVGVIANTKMAEAGLGNHEWKVWFANFTAHALVSVFAYWFFDRRQKPKSEVGSRESEAEERRRASEFRLPTSTFTRDQWLTLSIILVWVIGAVAFKLNPGLSAIAAATLIIVLRATDETRALKDVPWGVIVMVCGVSLLIALLEKTGGMEYFTALLARVSSPANIHGVIALITGAISTYSSTSGVVLPAFLPTVPKLAEQLGSVDPLAIALSVNVGSALVDVSPLSTLGALCVAAVSDANEAKQLFRQLLYWGLSMTLVGALLCQFFAGLLARL
jgi:di/tricarboxylate transporter